MPHCEAAGRDHFYCPSVKGGEDGRGNLALFSLSRTWRHSWALKARQVLLRIQDIWSVMCTPKKKLELLSLSTYIIDYNTHVGIRIVALKLCKVFTCNESKWSFRGGKGQKRVNLYTRLLSFSCWLFTLDSHPSAINSQHSTLIIQLSTFYT